MSLKFLDRIIGVTGKELFCMKNKYLFVLACTVLLLITPVTTTGSAPQSGILFTSEDGTITALFPSNPETQEIKKEGVEVTLAVAEKDGNVFAISFGPNNFLVDLLDSVRGMAQQVRGKIINVQDTRLDSFPGKVALVETKGGWVLYKNFQDTESQRLYAAFVASRDKSFLESKTVTKFFDSLHLKKMLRIWTDNTGKYNREARFIKLENGIVDLELANAKEIQVQLQKLSDADQEYATTMQNLLDEDADPAEEAKPVTKSIEEVREELLGKHMDHVKNLYGEPDFVSFPYNATAWIYNEPVFDTEAGKVKPRFSLLYWGMSKLVADVDTDNLD